MRSQKISNKRAGFQRREFQALIGLGNQYACIKDCRPYQEGDHVTIYFHKDATQSPSIWIEKYQNGPDKSLFIAWSWGAGGQIVSIARSEKFDHFTDQLKNRLDLVEETMTDTGSTVRVLAPQF